MRKKKMNKNNIDITKLSRLEKIVNSIKRNNPVETDPDITFEFLMASCFPSILAM